MKFSTIIMGPTMIALASCGGSGGGDRPPYLGEGGAAGARAAMNYVPVYVANGSELLTDVITDRGATGLIVEFGVVPGTLRFQNINVRLSPDKLTAYVSINGGAEQVLTDGPLFNDGGDYLLNMGQAPEDYFQQFLTVRGGETLGRGFVGIETPLANLPTGVATYTGDFSAALYASDGSDVDIITGDMAILIGFDSDLFTADLTDVGLTIATAGGDVSGNGIIGELTMQPDSGYIGTMPIIGKSLGFDGELMAGVFGADGVTTIASGQDFQLNGMFDAERTP